jgi:hypothetical protein
MNYELFVIEKIGGEKNGKSETCYHIAGGR